MNVEEKAKQQKFIVQNLAGIDSAVKSIVAVKDAFRAKVNDLVMHGSETYSPDYVEKELTKVKADIAVKMAAANVDMEGRLEELRGLLHDRDAVLDLNNPALTNALALIQIIGGKMSYDQAVKINANFVHDQSGLAALQVSYAAQGLNNPGGIDDMIYNADSAIDALKELAYRALVQDGSINFFSGKLAKMAALEGLTVETLPDQQGSVDAMRAAAGLKML